MAVEKLKVFVNGEFVESKTEKYFDVFNPSTGEVIAQAPCCTSDEVQYAIECAKAAFPEWKATPALKRAQILYKVRDLLIEHMDELTYSVAEENGKAWKEAEGDVLKAKEGTENALQIPTQMMGDSLMGTSKGFDTVLYREPIGVFAGIIPFNFPAMIPCGWMAPNCIAAGNCMVLKLNSQTPKTALKIAAIYKEAGLPDGVLNMITCSRNEVDEVILDNPDIVGISFVGSTGTGKHIYARAAASGKRVQCLCEAKNHALVLEDAPITRTAAAIINSSFGCAGERCMALPVVVVQESIADKLVAEIKRLAMSLKVGAAYDKTTGLGPVISAKHKERILNWIQKGLDEGATMVLDGREYTVDEGLENGFYLGPTILDNVPYDSAVGNTEIFGPVLCIKRVKDFEEGITVMNNNPFANGSCIFTQNGYYAREFTFRTDGGMVGVNVGIPVPVGFFAFSGHKQSFFGDLHCLGKDAVRFYTESKSVTTRWFDEEEMKKESVSTWDGTI